MTRRKIAAANWKMNLSIAEGIALVKAIQQVQDARCEIVIAPPFTHLAAIGAALDSNVKLAAQNCHYKPSGAYTGEIAISMLVELGVTYIITGHSERRQLFHESNDMIRMKVDAILEAGLTPIFCCGESLDIREADQHRDFVEIQLQESLFHLSTDQLIRVVIAYEPIWAIGTGVTASPEQAQEMHAHLRNAIERQYDPATAQAISILYGGSIKADNAESIFTRPDVDGGLVGGASLQADGFSAIIRACG